jgi:hypothetical protein
VQSHGKLKNDRGKGKEAFQLCLQWAFQIWLWQKDKGGYQHFQAVADAWHCLGIYQWMLDHWTGVLHAQFRNGGSPYLKMIWVSEQNMNKRFR